MQGSVFHSGSRRLRAGTTMARASLMIGAALAASALGATVATAKSSTKHPKKLSTWTLGALVDQTGVDADSAASEKAGANYYVDQINKAGGVDGHKLAFKFCDTQSTPQGGAQCAQQLASIPSHIVLSLSDDPVTRGALPYLTKDILVSVDSVLLPATGTTAYQTIVPNSIVSATLMKYLKQHNVKTLGVLYTTDTTGTKQLAAEQAAAQTAGIKVVSVAQTPGATDVTPELLQLKSAGAQAIFLASLGANATTAVTSYRTLDITTPIIGGGATTTNSFLEGLSGGVPAHFYGISVLVVNNGELSSYEERYWKQLDVDFKKYSGTTPDNETTTPAYAACVIASALKATKGGSTKKIAAYLKTAAIPCLGAQLKFNISGLNVVSGEPVQLAEAKSNKTWGAPHGSF